MLSGAVLKQFRTYLKSKVGHGWSVEGRERKVRLLTRVSFRYLTGERSVVLLEIDFDADNQDDIVRTVKKISDLMRERNIELSQAKELLCGGKIERTKIIKNVGEMVLETIGERHVLQNNANCW